MKTILTLSALFVCILAFAQTNKLEPNGNVGVGTTNPISELDVHGQILITSASNGRFMLINNLNWGNSGVFEATSTGDIHFKAYSLNFSKDQLFLQSNGNVGVGTTNPLTALDVRGALTLTNPTIYTGAVQTNHTYVQLINSLVSPNASGLKAGGILVSDSYNYANPDVNNLIVKGNVGIGTATPQEKLSVNGKIRAQEVKVENTSWPDYVFSKDYKLPSLEETEQHIKERGHLPGIPSAGEVQKNGLDLGEMNAKLLQKVEELTLHLIEKNKEIQNLTERMKRLEAKQNK